MTDAPKPQFLPQVSPTCGICAHFHTLPSDLKLGLCHRFPPVAHPLPGPQGQVISWADFPCVRRNQSCGEYKSNLKAMT